MTPITDEDLEQQLRDALDTGDPERIGLLAREVDQRQKAAAAVPLHAAALWYAEQGIKVFPLSPGSKIPFKGSNGCLDASSNADVVNGWWTQTPDANIGIATGHLVDVVDIDGLEGQTSRAHNAALFDSLTVLGKVSTPRPGGMHLYVPASGRGNKAGMLPSVDYRGLGGYVVAPPSVNETGTYRWLTPLSMSGPPTTGRVVCCERCGMTALDLPEDHNCRPTPPEAA